jgi:catalase-peroxidase
MDAKTSGDPSSGCPMQGAAALRNPLGRTNKDWWPEMLATEILNPNGSSNPMGADFDYAEAFKKLDYAGAKGRSHRADDRQPALVAGRLWHYGPFFIRMAWHAPAPIARADGRGGANSGQQRFAPLNSWPDNGNLDKARRLLWPIKQKYGKQISWADLFILTGNVAIESMGFRCSASAAAAPMSRARARHLLGRRRQMGGEGDRPAYPGMDRELDKPLAAIQMGLIYVNPEGPHGNPMTTLASARDMKETFARMAMNDEETVALTAGGHTFGKAHGAGDASAASRRRAGGRRHRRAGPGWKSGLRERRSASMPSPAGSKAPGRQHADRVDRELFPPAARL